MRIGLYLALLGATAQLAAAWPANPALAEVYYQRGRQAEQLGDAAFQHWLHTIRVPALDVATDRRIFAIDQYTNACYYDPAHWRAQKRLGFMLADVQGTHANDLLALEHLVAYLALNPDDPDAIQAKTICDKRLNEIETRLERFKIQGERNVDVMNAVILAIGTYLEEYQSVARTEPVPVASPQALWSRGLPDVFSEQIVFYGELASRVLLRDQAVAGGGEMAGGAPAGGPGPGDPGAGGAEGGGGGGGAGVLSLGSGDFSGDSYNTPVHQQIAEVAAYVPVYLGIMGGMHRFMWHLDTRRVAYDPRLPEQLIGESVLQLRRLFTRGEVGNLAQVKNEWAAVARLGQTNSLDFWTGRDYTAELPDYLLAAGTLERPELESQYYAKVVGPSAIRLPGYNPAEDAAKDFAEEVLSAGLSTQYSFESWARWRHIHLAETPAAYGLREPEQVFLRDWQRLGAGEITPWIDGPLPIPMTMGAAPDERGWLMAGAN